MKKLFSLLCLVIAIGFTHAQENLTQNTIQGLLKGNQDQVIQLAEAFSENQYDWRPMEGVNSVADALLHVASANYFIGTKMGFAPPEDVDIMALGKITGKDNIITALKESNAWVLDKLNEVSTDELANEVDFGFMKMNKLGGLLIIMEHNGEHKGQLIAYARSNGVVPPWSK
ncbi:DinB family protein [Maribacter cobaltidurans]|uniref:Damage-inducible protein DinB n=1 Tax=Maribacter cobaltidurans TaxID=1178778 RepID=A0A223V703_9FLAO|nr:DinB family protein [Maribacter cobaltidurans]ASV31195.1 damage-inducible protein DinB [Maribacter cobaltidurans]GGD84299.1 hypothetical protein GCM10011412_22600 [Maribacter cobaltidurans]